MGNLPIGLSCADSLTFGNTRHRDAKRIANTFAVARISGHTMAYAGESGFPGARRRSSRILEKRLALRGRHQAEQIARLASVSGAPRSGQGGENRRKSSVYGHSVRQLQKLFDKAARHCGRNLRSHLCCASTGSHAHGLEPEAPVDVKAAAGEEVVLEYKPHGMGNFVGLPQALERHRRRQFMQDFRTHGGEDLSIRETGRN
jgi:hypothetical protein